MASSLIDVTSPAIEHETNTSIASPAYPPTPGANVVTSVEPDDAVELELEVRYEIVISCPSIKYCHVSTKFQIA
jgi:hypothetical protein